MLKSLPMVGLVIGLAAIAGLPASAQHTADQNDDFVVSLSELLRVIQFFNSDGLHCDEIGEDGYAPGLGDTTCAPHDSDYNAQDWDIVLSELLRLIQFYNVGEYHCDLAGEDGYVTGAGSQDCDGPPNVVTITQPTDGAFIYADGMDEGGWYATVTLMGSASDPEDGALTGTSLEWSTALPDEAAEFLGTGESLTTKLYSASCSGTDRIVTLTAIDSATNQATTSIEVTMTILCK